MSPQPYITRLPQPVAAHTTLPVGSLDVLPLLAAARWPNRTALLDEGGTITFAELDRGISRLASGLRELLGGEGSVVAVSSVLGADFPLAYYAVVRSGNVVAPVNPRLSADVFEQLLKAIGARAVVLARGMYDRVRPALAWLGLEQVILLDSPAEAGVPTCAELATRGDLLVEPRDRDENELGAIMLGAGTAGYAKAAGVTHHGLKVDAARTGARHDLTERSIAINALPSYHAEHLNAAVWTGATQVLCASPDPAVLAREAERYDASHCYALPTAAHSGEVHRWPVVLPRKAAVS